ncbi:MAG: aldehyde dehydrogenase family protein, partial [Caldilineaceae bacterium]|nr:aldehyde dehydrogenase family protein [Caldilineaceae bacterium]
MDYKHFIDGQWVDSQGGAPRTIVNPATGQPLATVPDGTRADVDRAVQAAKRAFYDGRWSRKTPGERSLALFRLADLLEQHGERIGR